MELRILDPYDLTLVAWVRIDSNGFDCWGDSNLQDAFVLWEMEGIREWVNLDGMPEMRTTLSHDPEFLQRLASYIQRQSGFVCQLVETV